MIDTLPWRWHQICANFRLRFCIIHFVQLPPLAEWEYYRWWGCFGNMAEICHVFPQFLMNECENFILFVGAITRLLLFRWPVHQSQCSCRSEESRKSAGMLRGVSAPLDPGGMVKSSHSMLSRPASDRPMLREEGGEESQKDRSDVSMGE